MRITTRLTILVSSLAIVPWALGLYTAKLTRRALGEQITGAAEHQAGAILDELDRCVHGRASELAILLETDYVRRVLAGANDAGLERPDREAWIDRVDASWCSAPPDAPCTEAVRLLESELSCALRQQLDRVTEQHGFPVFGELFITNRFGVPIALTGVTSDFRQNDEEWWTRTWSEGLYFGDVAFDQSAQMHAVEICLRIDDDHGNPLGVAKAVLNILEVKRIVDARLSRSSELPMRLELLTREGATIHKGQSASWEPTDDVLTSTAAERGHGAFSGLGWSLVVHHDSERVFAPVVALTRTIGAVSIVVALVSLGAGLAIAGGVATRLRALRTTTALIGAGKLGAQAHVGGEDEVGALARAINSMSTDLADAEAARVEAGRVEAERDHLREAVVAHQRVLGVLGHEVRTPLAAVRMTAEFLVRSCATGDTPDSGFLQSIVDEVVRLSETVNNMLEAARIESGIARWNREAIDMGELAREVTRVVGRLVDDERVSLDYDVEPEADMEGDRDAIRRLLINLLSNAAKHTNEGSITLRVTSEPEAIRIVITDTGCGMPPSILQELGEPFRLNRGGVGADFASGAGLGLAICKQIIAAHDGAMEVRSAVGQGSTFDIRLARTPRPDRDGDPAWGMQEEAA